MVTGVRDCPVIRDDRAALRIAEVSVAIGEIEDDLKAKLVGAVGSKPRPTTPVTSTKPAAIGASTWPPAGPRVVFIAVSTGGPAALSRVIPSLPGDLRLGVVIVQHMPAQFTGALAERLDSLSAVKVREARQGDVPRQGLVLVAPGDKHLEVRDRGVLHIVDAIVAGEGEGPLEPTPIDCGMLIGGSSALAVDSVAATLMGFDARRIPIVAHG